jgi:hypothetical protein
MSEIEKLQRWKAILKARCIAPAPASAGCGTYDNKRTEMNFQAVDWIRKGGALPPDPSQELIAALTRTTYSFRGDRLLLEPKDQVKARLGDSPRRRRRLRDHVRATGGGAGPVLRPDGGGDRHTPVLAAGAVPDGV